MNINNIFVMVVTYNRLQLTEETINRLLKSTKQPFNLVVVDNGSSDDTHKYLQQLMTMEHDLLQSVKIIFNPSNKGIAIARNQALKAAVDSGAEWLCTLDNDVWLPDGWLEECIDILTKNIDFGMIGVNMENVPYELKTLNNKTFQVKPSGNLGTACIVFKNSLFKMLGYFNTEYKNYAHEDADMGVRVRAIKLKMGYIKEMGKHLGEGENDMGEYRKFKNKHHKDNLPKFRDNAKKYMTGQKKLFIPFRDE